MSYPVKFSANASTITVTHPEEWLWVVELQNGNDNHLDKAMVEQGLQPALDVVEKDWRTQWRTSKKNKEKTGPPGALVFVGAGDKFFSNGLDYAGVIADLNFFPVTYDPFLARLLTFPIPTIAAINGHCMAGSMMLATACDYRVMTDGSSKRAFMCMNEVLFGAIWPLSFAALARAKFPGGQRLRKIAIEGHKFTPQEALADGLVDHIVAGDTNAVIAKAAEVGKAASASARGGTWGLIKADLFRDVLDTFRQQSRPMNPEIDNAAAERRLGLSKL
ncbi:ClpP/crotonase [Cylindrobasidium torrendii FP15055 ss-10]|uniref:ClpP/crotonase n=1 Tax=Cylindrobasidium torrendii FP15055 ss-10 TaxID=1314674 RepID=A0A0D7B7P7_9AGAR|nr:ClpP/crotonase [Cylindrobasidium torrendii FP15055 ss-10]